MAENSKVIGKTASNTVLEFIKLKVKYIMEFGKKENIYIGSKKMKSKIFKNLLLIMAYFMRK